MNYDWLDFSDEARKAIRQTELDPRGGFIKYIYEPSFDNPFCLNVAVDSFHWEKVVWNRVVDAQKFEIIEALKYVGSSIAPTILRQYGVLDPDRCDGLLGKIQRIELPLLLGKDEWLIIDGETHTLTLGNNNRETTYRWTSLPYEWRALGEITKELLACLLK